MAVAMLLCVATSAWAQSPPPTSGWVAQDIAHDIYGRPRVMWRDGAGQMILWQLDSSGQVESSALHGTPNSGWSADAMAVGPDNKTRVIWSHTNGSHSLWTAGPGGSYESSAPANPGSGWRAIDIAVDALSRMRVLWRRGDGAGALWLVNSSYIRESGGEQFGPWGGWSPRALSVGPDGKTRLMWGHDGGSFALWTVGATGVRDATGHAIYSFGPYSNWSPTDLSVGSDNQTRLFWSYIPDGRASLWNINAGGVWNGQSFTYGPFGAANEWRAKSISHSGGIGRLAWNRNDGVLSIWGLNPNNSFNETYWDYNVPPSGLSAQALGGRVRLTWQRNTDSVSSWPATYTIYRSTSATSGFTSIASVPASPGSAASYTDRGLSNNTTYYYRVAALSRGIESAPASTSGTPSPLALDAEVVSQQVTGTMTPEYSYPVTITVRNIGTSTWTGGGAQPLSLGLHSQTDTTTWGRNRKALPAGVSVAPGDTYAFVFTVRAPGTGDLYPFQWRMVQDGTGGAGFLGDSGPVANINVLPLLSIEDTWVFDGPPASPPGSGNGTYGATTARFTVRLSHPTARPVSFRVKTRNGTAYGAFYAGEYGADFEHQDTPLTFQPGTALTRTVSVPILGSRDWGEPDEEFKLIFDTVSQPITNAVMSQAESDGTCLILNDDNPRPTPNPTPVPSPTQAPRPTASISPASTSVTETNAGTWVDVPFEVRLSHPIDTMVSVRLRTQSGTATSDADFNEVDKQVVFDPDDTLKTVLVRVNGDNLDEDNETFTVSLSPSPSANVGNATSTVTINDNDEPPTVSVNSPQVLEGNTGTTNLLFTLSLSQVSGRAVTVAYATQNGTAAAPGDYTSTSGTATIAAGATSQTVSVPIVGDGVVEPDETFTLTLSNPGNASLGTAVGTGTIVNDDTNAPLPTISVANAPTVTEGAPAPNNEAAFVITLSAPSAEAVSVTATTFNASATSGTDYTGTTQIVRFDPGQTSKTVRVPILNDDVVEPNETFTLRLSNPSRATLGAAGTEVGVGTIVNDDVPPPSISIDDASVTETDAPQNLTLTVTLSQPSAQAVTVNYTTQNGTAQAPGDYLTRSGILTFNANQTTTTLTVPIVGDDVAENAEAFTVLLSQPSGATIGDGSATVSIADDDSAPQEPTYSVDAAIVPGAQGTVFEGEGEYLPTEQASSSSTVAGTAALFIVRAYNRSSVSAKLVFAGQGNTPGWTVKYFDATTDVSAAVKGATYATANPVEVGGSYDIRVEIKPDNTVADGAVRQVAVSAFIQGNSGVMDTVLARVTKSNDPGAQPTPVPQSRPDALVRLAHEDESGYIGDGLYQTPVTVGASQTKAQNASQEVAAVYHIKIQNDGTGADRFKVIGPAVADRWTVDYYKSLDGAAPGDRITEEVRDTGWKTDLAPGQSYELRVSVTPRDTAQDGSSNSTIVQVFRASDTTNSGISDVVRVTTTKLTSVAQTPAVTFTGSTRACAGAVNNNLHRLTLNAQVRSGTQPMPGASITFAFENTVGHDYGDGQPRKSAKFIKSNGDLVDTLTLTSDANGQINGLQVLSSDVISQPRVVARWTSPQNNTATVGGVRCSFEAMTSKRGFPDPALGDYPGWQSGDNGWTCDLATAARTGNGVAQAKVYIKFPDANGVLQPVVGHKIKISIFALKLRDDSEIFDPAESIRYVSLLDADGQPVESLTVTTDGDGIAQVNVKANADVSGFAGLLLDGDNVTQWSR